MTGKMLRDAQNRPEIRLLHNRLNIVDTYEV